MRAAVWLAAALLCWSAGSARADDLEGAAVRALFRLSAMKLNDVPSCRGVGLTETDRTLGDFLGSILAQFVSFRPKEPVLRVRSTEPAKGVNAPVEVTFYKKEGEEEWSWGLAFTVNTKTGQALPKSVRCIVAG